MAFKTMLRQILSKWGVMSVEMVKAFENDDAVIREDGSAEYVDTEEAFETTATEIPKEEAKKQDKEETLKSAEEALFGEEATK